MLWQPAACLEDRSLESGYGWRQSATLEWIGVSIARSGLPFPNRDLRLAWRLLISVMS